jgi:hypothetical protein
MSGIEGLIKQNISYGNNDHTSLTIRQKEQLKRAIGDSELNKNPIRNSVKVGFGEYSPSEDVKINNAKFYAKTGSFAHQYDRDTIEKSFRHIDKYEKLGLEFGVFFGTVFMLLPGIRKLPFYTRIPVGMGVFAFCVRWGKNYGKDLTAMRFNPMIETQERERGVRNFQTSM